MVALGFWVMLPDPSGGPSRRLVIGPTARGRWLTLVVGLTDASAEYVPVTCWPSTTREQSLYWRRFR